MQIAIVQQEKTLCAAKRDNLVGTRESWELLVESPPQPQGILLTQSRANCNLCDLWRIYGGFVACNHDNNLA